MPLRLWGPNAARFDLRNHRKIVVVDGECAFFGSQNIVSAHANRGMVNEEMLVRATGPIVRHLHAVLLGDRYLETGTLPPESDDLSPAPSERCDGRPRAGGAERPGLQRGHGGSGHDRAHVRRALARRADVAVRHSRARRSCRRCAAPRGAASPSSSIVDAESNKPLVQLAQQSFYDAMLRAGVTVHAPSRQLPAREAHERRRRGRADRLVELRHPLVRAERGGERADLRPRRGRRPAPRSRKATCATATGSPWRSARGCRWPGGRWRTWRG